MSMEITTRQTAKEGPAEFRIALSDWVAGGRRFAHRGHDIFYRTDGPPDGEPLLLIHGFPTASWDWQDLWPELSARYRCLAPDLIGFGISAKPRRYGYSIMDQADLCESLLRREGVARYHVLAHDYGDTVAQELLARQHEPGSRPQVLSVALLNGGLFPEVHRPARIQRLLLSPVGPLIARLSKRAPFGRKMARIFGPNTQPSEDLLDKFWWLITTNEGTAITHKLVRYMVERRTHRERWVGALQRSPVPLCFINGTVDPISGAHMAARYRELIPLPDVRLLEGIGHYPQVEAPERVLDAYMAFRDLYGAAPQPVRGPQ